METVLPAPQGGLTTTERVVPIPKNLLEMTGVSLDSGATAVIERILGGQTDLRTNLLELSWYWKVRVWFSSPVEVQITKRRTKTTDVHIFPRFFRSTNGAFCYMVSRGHRSGYHFWGLDKMIVKYEPVFEQQFDDQFKSYEQFKRKFDLHFITEAEVQSLWNGTSGQHGGKYRKSDFRRIGSHGKRCLDNFLRFFKGISNGGDLPGYRLETDGQYFILREHVSAWGNKHFSRDITISHQTNIDYVYYASEFHGCGNGRYGLLANKNEFLWLEDD
jgi:hypothetical protein